MGVFLSNSKIFFSTICREIDGVLFFMGWKDKAQEIAFEIISKMDESLQGSYTHSDVLQALEQAAITGMAYECDIAVMPLLAKLNKHDDDETRTSNIRFSAE